MRPMRPTKWEYLLYIIFKMKRITFNELLNLLFLMKKEKVLNYELKLEREKVVPCGELIEDIDWLKRTKLIEENTSQTYEISNLGAKVAKNIEEDASKIEKEYRKITAIKNLTEGRSKY